MTLERIDHLGIAVASVAEARVAYERLLRLEHAGDERVESQSVATSFYRCGPSHIELLEATDPDGPVGRFMSSRGPGIHHVAFAVDDIDAELARLKQEGARLVDERPRAGSRGTRVAFLHPKSMHGVLVELVEHPKG